ncbi:hypothetical protein ZIOFF_068924 [Zingiber officinale]|uniref:non-specific serine/threonine protein kinase n=1 Tax=Zingiber officinale TaxID=94328 RepID=A0A8J5CB32_ZINOF|nr:hypothetical protein ZIOFF_068924 [Zingiber officinale]
MIPTSGKPEQESQEDIAISDAEANQLLASHSMVTPEKITDTELSEKWMAFPTGGSKMHPVSSEILEETSKDGSIQLLNQRLGEWGIAVSSDRNKISESLIRASGEGNKLSMDRFSGSARPSDDSSYPRGSVPRVSQELKDALSSLQQTFVVSDATKPDCPIVYASTGFFTMTGYSAKEIIGKNCRFLQGPETDRLEIEKIKEAMRTGKTYCGRLLNYKKDGTKFWNLLTVTPIRNEDGNIIKYIGMQVEVSKYTEGLNDKTLRPNALPMSLIRYDARQQAEAISSIEEVVQTLKHPHNHSQSEDHDTFSKLDEGKQIHVDSPYQDSRENKNLKAPSGLAPPLDAKLDLPMMSTRKSGRSSLIGFRARKQSSIERYEPVIEPEILMTKEVQRTESWDRVEREKDMRQGIDLATTLERIEKNFVITDPRLPDNPIIFASDSFLELTEYSREEILGKNCRFLQGPETDQGTVAKIRDAIRDQREVTVQLINYTKSAPDTFQVKATAENVDEAVRELPDPNLRPEDLWEIHSKPVFPKPHKKENSSWLAIEKVIGKGETIGLKHFKPIKPLGCGDTGSVHLVELQGTGELFAMKAMDKSIMLNRNKQPKTISSHHKDLYPLKSDLESVVLYAQFLLDLQVHRACIEREIYSLLDHPFLPTLYTSFQTTTHVCLITDFCPGGELFALLDKQPMKIFKEEAARFYAAEVVVGLEYLHCQGIIYRDLKPENILLQKDGHVVLTDFDLSFLTNCKPQVIKQPLPSKRRKSRDFAPPTFVAEPNTQSNSFVGTEEYIAPEIITGAGHSSAIDWWALGILLYEMMYGRTPFRGKNRQKTFANILRKDLTFPSSIPVSLAARQLIHGLLNRDPVNRLGSKTGANEIKQHSFFREINWPLIRCMTPPELEVPLQVTGREPDSKVKDAQWADEQMPTDSLQNL